jgi:3-isopropylmalate/(R)-2-methylmalate dehydratase large subunit
VNLDRQCGPQTLVDKIWAKHRVTTREDGQDLLFVDRHFIHDVTATAFDMLRARASSPGLPVGSSGRPTTTCRPTAARWRP